MFFSPDNLYILLIVNNIHVNIYHVTERNGEIQNEPEGKANSNKKIYYHSYFNYASYFY